MTVVMPWRISASYGKDQASPARISHVDNSLTLLLFMSERKRNKWKTKTDGRRARACQRQLGTRAPIWERAHGTPCTHQPLPLHLLAESSSPSSSPSARFIRRSRASTITT